jgi:hypothetical protein
MDSASFMSKQAVLGGLIASVVAACSGGSPSEQVVRRNLPVERAVSSPDTQTNVAAPRSVAERVNPDRQGITSQEVERELNRLEAELR